ncbi:DUF2860 family protein [Pseudaeromonas sp. ZJS20]|uniref:DUF2860 family protein n=1 Tax=Pseudaeromonas aegiceratis TaxID=3153928 RepID=UPI00390CC429
MMQFPLSRALLALALLPAIGHAEVLGIPKEDGFSGFLLMGAAYNKVDSNILVGPDKSASRRINSLSDMASSDGTRLNLNADLRYTFAAARTQIYLGNLIQDALRLDFSQQLGIRREFGDQGIGSIAYVFSGIPTEQWQDPYLTGDKRHATDRNSRGVRLGWDGIAGSAFDASYTFRNIQLDDERSGDSISSLTPAQRASLDRNGSSQALDLAYNWRLGQGRMLRPSLTYSRKDADGAAMDYDRLTGQLSYSLMTPQYSLISNLFVGTLRYDEANPVFNRKADADEYGLNVNFLWHRLAGIDKLNGTLTATYGKSDADVHFFDSELSQLSAGVLYNF